MSTEYRSFLDDAKNGIEIGFHPTWEKLRMTVTDTTYDVDSEIYLTPDEATRIAVALIAAARAKEQS